MSKDTRFAQFSVLFPMEAKAGSLSHKPANCQAASPEASPCANHVRAVAMPQIGVRPLRRRAAHTCILMAAEFIPSFFSCS